MFAVAFGAEVDAGTTPVIGTVAEIPVPTDFFLTRLFRLSLAPAAGTELTSRGAVGRFEVDHAGCEV